MLRAYISPLNLMQNAGVSRPSHGELGLTWLRNLRTAYWNLGNAQLIEKAIQRHEGTLLATAARFVVRTGQFTGRSPEGQVHCPRAGHGINRELGIREPADDRGSF